MHRRLVWKWKILKEEDLGIVLVKDEAGAYHEAFRSVVLIKMRKGKPAVWKTVDIDRNEVRFGSYNLGLSYAEYRRKTVREIVDRFRM